MASGPVSRLKVVPIQAARSFSVRRSIVILVLALALAGVLIVEALGPVRLRVAQRYLSRGDSYLAAQEFDAASAEYDKALHYDSSLQAARDHLALAESAPTDIARLRAFYQEHGVQAVVDKLDRAQKAYTDPKEALTVGASFYEAHDFSYAQYPLLLATQLDPGYPEAWNYLGLTYQELARDNASYRAKATAAFAKRDSLTLKYIQGVP
jgi:Tfp pilus assembly protein PilF